MAADAHDVGPSALYLRNGRQLILMMLGSRLLLEKQMAADAHDVWPCDCYLINNGS